MVLGPVWPSQVRAVPPPTWRVRADSLNPLITVNPKGNPAQRKIMVRRAT